ncbi:MAG: hypothetical protein V4725_19695 [Bacteroidota bacterium]
MAKYLPFLLLAVLLSACGSNKSYLERSNENKSLQDAVKKLHKNPSDAEAMQAVPILYASILKTHLARVASYQTGNDPSRWDNIIAEYSALQDAYSNIVNSTAAFRLVTPENFSSQLLDARHSAAEDYYAAGESYLNRSGRDNAKTAYNYYKKADRYESGYKDVRTKINQAFENSVVDVVINPIEDDRYFFNSGWGSSGLNYSNEYFQRTLVRDLADNNNNSNYAARFYSDWEAQRANIQVDWAVDLRLRNMNLPQPVRNTYRQNRSKQIQSGTDTAGKPVYQTVNASLNITRMSFVAEAQMDVYIRDLSSQRTISNRSFRENYRWEEERATYSGDQRALTSQDWNMINNSSFYTPRREEVLEQLYRKLYPQVLNSIRYAVD